MAEQNANASPFPTPPPFYQHFTKENLARLRQLRAEAGIPPVLADSSMSYDDPKRDVDILSLPSELRHLIPPEPPTDGKYSSFGDDVDLNAPTGTLADAGIEHLYPATPSVYLNPQPHLIALTRSLLVCFLALTGILSHNPELYEAKAQDMQTITYNIEHLINRYRPHQARETLINMMQERVDKMKGEVQAIDEAKEKVARLLQDLQDNGTVQTMQEEHDRKAGGAAEDIQTAKRKARQRAAWAALEAEMG